MTSPKDEPGSFTLAVLMQHAGKLLDDHLRAGFERVDLHPSQGRVLHLLERRDGFEQGKLASMMKVSAPTVSGILTRMEAEGLIERRADAADERVTRAFLTAKGNRKCKVARAIVDEVEQVLITGLTRTQLRSAHRLLRQLRNNLGGEPPGPEPSVAAIVP